MAEIWNLSAICRCCHSDGHFKSLNRPYVVKNDVEIYYSMLRDTFGIIIEPPVGDISYTICDICIKDLQRATRFKKQVLICEAKFEEYCKNEASQLNHDSIKIELDSDDDKSFGEDFNTSYEDTEEKNIYSETKDEEKVDVKNGIEDIKQEDDTKETVDISKEIKKTVTVKSKKCKKAGTKIRNSKFKNLEFIVESEDGDCFSCKLCGRSYKSIKTIRRHITLNHDPDANKCRICHMKFQNRNARIKHMATHKQAYTCSFCSRIFPFNRKYSFKLHINSHTKQSTFECDYCNKQFLHKRSLTNHIIMLHLGLPIRKVICDICGHTFNDVTNMRKHIQTVHEKLRLFKCQRCPKDFTAKKHLLVHERRQHTGETPYACDECDQAYPCSEDLKKHKLVVHIGKKVTFTCKLCRNEYSSRSGLVKHFKTHAGSKPLLCHLCNKDFACKYSLNRHISYHSGERRFQCDICFRKFHEKITLKKHAARFHSGKVVEKKQCHMCKRQVTDLEKHLAMHNNKPHCCEYCSKRYTERKALNRHVANTHFGRKAHPCDLCNVKYVNLNTLVRHKLKVHKVETKVEKEGLNDYVTKYVGDDNKKAMDVCS